MKRWNGSLAKHINDSPCAGFEREQEPSWTTSLDNTRRLWIKSNRGLDSLLCRACVQLKQQGQTCKERRGLASWFIDKSAVWGSSARLCQHTWLYCVHQCELETVNSYEIAWIENTHTHTHTHSFSLFVVVSWESVWIGSKRVISSFIAL